MVSVKEIKGDITCLKEGKKELIKTLENLNEVCEDLTKCATKLKDVLLNLKVEEGSPKLLNDEFRENVKRLEGTSKTAHVEIQGEPNELGATVAIEEPSSDAPILIPQPNTRSPSLLSLFLKVIFYGF